MCVCVCDRHVTQIKTEERGRQCEGMEKEKEKQSAVIRQNAQIETERERERGSLSPGHQRNNIWQNIKCDKDRE